MGGSQKTAKKGNAIAAASLAEQKRQYNEQKERENSKKAAAKSNALGVRKSANRAYANTFNQATDFGVGLDGGYSLLTAGGTPSAINNLLSDDNLRNSNDTLG